MAASVAPSHLAELIQSRRRALRLTWASLIRRSMVDPLRLEKAALRGRSLRDDELQRVAEVLEVAPADLAAALAADADRTADRVPTALAAVALAALRAPA